MNKKMVDKVLSEDKQKILYIPTEKLKSEYAMRLNFCSSLIDECIREVPSLMDKKSLQLLSQKVGAPILYILNFGSRESLDTYLSILADKLIEILKGQQKELEKALIELDPSLDARWRK